MPQPLPEISGYTLQEQAGKGGMGTVYIAEQLSPRRTVAMKLLSRAPNAEILAEFRREAEAIAGLEHPRIVPVYAYGEESGIPYLVMRYLPGGSLADRIPMDLAQCKRWLEEIGSALDYAHGRGFVHRDVKPSNILLDEQGRAYLSDFGIAGTLADIESSLPSGSAAYMAPEQGRGEGIDSRADIYSLAVTLFEALTGQLPFTAESALGVIARHMHYPVPSVSELEPAIPLAVDQVIQQGMAKAPADRPDTAGEFARRVDKAPLADSETGADQESTAASGATLDLESTALGQGKPRPKWLIGAIAIGIAAIAIVGVGALVITLTGGSDPVPAATLPAVTAAGSVTDIPPNMLLQDDFSDPTSGFAVLSDADGGVEYADGALQFTVLTDGVRWYSPSARIDALNVLIEAEVRLLSGPLLGEIALLCRWEDLENFTALALRADGAAAIWRVRAGETSMLQDWAFAPSVDVIPGQLIHLRAICMEDELRLEVGGRTVVSVTESATISGDVALMAGLGEPGELKVLFDTLRVERTQGME